MGEEARRVVSRPAWNASGRRINKLSTEMLKLQLLRAGEAEAPGPLARPANRRSAAHGHMDHAVHPVHPTHPTHPMCPMTAPLARTRRPASPRKFSGPVSRAKSPNAFGSSSPTGRASPGKGAKWWPEHEVGQPRPTRGGSPAKNELLAQLEYAEGQLRSLEEAAVQVCARLRAPRGLATLCRRCSATDF